MNSYKESQPGMNGQPSIWHVTVEQGRHSVHIENLFRLDRERKDEIRQLRADRSADREYMRKQSEEITSLHNRINPIERIRLWVMSLVGSVITTVAILLVTTYVKSSL